MTRSTRAKPFSTLHLNKLLAKERGRENRLYWGRRRKSGNIENRALTVAKLKPVI